MGLSMGEKREIADLFGQVIGRIEALEARSMALSAIAQWLASRSGSTRVKAKEEVVSILLAASASAPGDKRANARANEAVTVIEGILGAAIPRSQT